MSRTLLRIASRPARSGGSAARSAAAISRAAPSVTEPSRQCAVATRSRPTTAIASTTIIGHSTGSRERSERSAGDTRPSSQPHRPTVSAAHTGEPAWELARRPSPTDAVRRLMEIAGSAALVTGAASGLGAATAAALAARGVTVYGLDLEKAVAGTTAPDGVTLLPADVTEESGVREALARIDDDGQQLRLAANCAGIAPSARIVSRRGPHDLDLFRTVVGVNLVGTFNVLRLAADAMSRLPADADGQRGVIVNTASIAAFEAQIGQVAYAASKAGVAGMTVTAARDLAQHGIRVMAIAPGVVDTPMMAGMPDDVRAGLAAGVPFPKRLGRPEEYARLVLMVVAHDYLNGETIRMDGALRMGPR